MRKMYALLGILCALALGAQTASAANFAYGSDLIFDLKSPFNDDVYLLGNDISISQNVLGDLVVVGSNVTIDGNVSGDVTAIGANVVVNGNVNDDVRIAAARVEINGIVGDDVILAGAYSMFGKTVNIGGDAIVASAQFDHKGSVNGSLNGAFMKGRFVGNVNRGATIKTKTLIFGKNARIRGNLSYTAPIASQIPDGVVGGKIDYKKYDSEALIDLEAWKKRISFDFIYLKIASTLSFITLALVLILGTPHFLLRTNDVVRKSTLKVLGVGVITVLGLIISTMIAFFFSGVAVYIGMLLTLAMVGIAIFTPVVASAVVGSYMVKVNNKSTKWRLFISFLVGMFVYNLLFYIPIVGWAFNVFVALLAVGAMTMLKKEHMEVLRKKKLV